MDIGGRIRAARKRAGLSQEEVARRAGMSLKGMAYIERGHIEDPHISSVRSIADALGVAAGELLGEPVPSAPKVDAPKAGRPDTSETIASTVHDLVIKQDRREAQAFNRLDESRRGQESFGHDEHEAMTYLLGLPKGVVAEAYIDLMRSHVSQEREIARLEEERDRAHVND